MDPFLRTRISFQYCVSNTFGLWFRVWIQALSSWFLGLTRLHFGSLLCTSISLRPCLKNIWIKVPCPRTRINLCLTRIRFQSCSNTFDFGCFLFPLPPAPARGTNLFDFVCVPVDLKHQTIHNFVLVYFHNSDQCNSDIQGRACQDDSVVIYNWISGRTTGIMTSGHVVVVLSQTVTSVGSLVPWRSCWVLCWPVDSTTLLFRTSRSVTLTSSDLHAKSCSRVATKSRCSLFRVCSQSILTAVLDRHFWDLHSLCSVTSLTSHGAVYVCVCVANVSGSSTLYACSLAFCDLRRRFRMHHRNLNGAERHVALHR